MMFSVVITTKDRADFLNRAVKSISASSVLPRDVVIVNDGGHNIDVSMFQPSQIEFKILNNEQSRGANYSRNIGIDHAEEEIVFLLDDDDAVTYSSFESRIKAFSDENVGLSFTGMHVVFSNNLLNVKRTVTPSRQSSYYPLLLKSGNIIGSTSRVAIRKFWFNKAGRFDEGLGCFQDYDLWIRMAKLCKFSSDFDAGIFYTIHKKGTQISSNYQKYLDATDYLVEKYKGDALASNSLRSFRAHLYLRVAIATSGTDFFIKSKYCLLSLSQKPTLRALALFLLPTPFLKKLFNFV